MAKLKQISPKEAYEEEKKRYWDLIDKLNAMSDKEQKSKEGQSVIFAIGGFEENNIAKFHWDREQERLKEEEELENKYGGGTIPKRYRSQEGGALMVPPEMEEIPEDTYIPEEQMNAEASQVPDEQMEDEFVDHVVDTALDDDEQSYLMSALEADERLSEIFDKVVETASEFSGEGEVEGPGTGVSDSIPARLSDGEFVMTQKATDQIGADNLQTLMDEAERAFEGGYKRIEYAFGGTVEDDEDEKSLLGKKEDEEIKKQMITANRMPSVI